jgi:hypothetical protein
MNYFVLAAFVVILGSLVAAGVFMTKGGASKSDDPNAPNKGMAKALAVRIAISVLVFIAVLIAWYFDFLKPSGIPMGK